MVALIWFWPFALFITGIYWVFNHLHQATVAFKLIQ
jgi:apolipoprotein N-acyltransferase